MENSDRKILGWNLVFEMNTPDDSDETLFRVVFDDENDVAFSHWTFEDKPDELFIDQYDELNKKLEEMIRNDSIRMISEEWIFSGQNNKEEKSGE